MSLHYFPKNTTPPIQFRTAFLEFQQLHNDYKFIYTDGSKNKSTISFSIVDNNKILLQSVLPPYTSVFTAEIIAIHKAIELTLENKWKSIICSDSLASLQAINNPNNNNIYTVLIRSALAANDSTIILLWVPGHCNIKGNEFADQAAKGALNAPVIMTTNISPQDINHSINLHFKSLSKSIINNTSIWYKNINPNFLTIKDYKTSFTNLTRRDQIRFLRLRLGHTKQSHGKLLKLSVVDLCDCNVVDKNSLIHIISSCPKLVKAKSLLPTNSDPLALLANPTTNNINCLLRYLGDANISFAL